MAHKADLRKLRANTVINTRSKRQEKALSAAVEGVRTRLAETFPGITLSWSARVYLCPLIEALRTRYPEISFCSCHENSFMTPDGGVLFLVGKDGTQYPILISEKKNQGTNDQRLKEGKKRQAQGNAIERLGKNVIGFRVMMAHESIFPFVCFGDGCDFDEAISILDRVKTIAMFGTLNEEHLHREGDLFNRGTFYFRVPEWTKQEMEDLCFAIAEKSVYYYFSRYGKASFTPAEK